MKAAEWILERAKKEMEVASNNCVASVVCWEGADGASPGTRGNAPQTSQPIRAVEICGFTSLCLGW